VTSSSSCLLLPTVLSSNQCQERARGTLCVLERAKGSEWTAHAPPKITNSGLQHRRTQSTSYRFDSCGAGETSNGLLALLQELEGLVCAAEDLPLL
jgi:hypothetical protein